MLITDEFAAACSSLCVAVAVVVNIQRLRVVVMICCWSASHLRPHSWFCRVRHVRKESALRILTNAIIVLIILGTTAIWAAPQRSATIMGSNSRVPYQRKDSTLLLDANATAVAFGWQAKIVRPGQLLTLCRNESRGVCIPVQLANVKIIEMPGTLFIDAAVLARALRFTIKDSDNQVILRPGQPKITDEDIPAYNAAWGEGRGFRVGQTLPDIPLYDMTGREVRLSRFLGKQYVIYCWASW